jgi:two-component system NtrC family response regulator
MTAQRVLLVEDDEAFARRFAQNLRTAGYDVDTAPGGAEALSHLAAHHVDLVITDIRMPRMDGLELIRVLKGEEARDPDLPVLVLTSLDSVQTAVEAMRLGAADYITKESERAEILVRIEKVLGQSRLANENRLLRRQLDRASEFGDIVGDSAAMGRIKTEIQEVAPSEATVLISGETGSGKELVARAIHSLSGRRAGPFVDVNCAALPDENLMLSELFGHERGAFTGAVALRRGLFEMAQGGTVFMDEVGELSPEAQGRLLRAIESSTVTRLGGSRPVPISVRLLFATNRDLAQDLGEGRFREDLYYRINVVPLEVPPLREHPEDIPALMDFFLSEYCSKYSRPLKHLTQTALGRLCAHPWPGNIRELRNAAERVVIRVPQAEIDVGDLDAQGIFAPGVHHVAEGGVQLPPEGMPLENIEKSLVTQALERTGWNQKEAAKLLGLTADQMHHRVKKFGLRHASWRKHR